MDNRDAQKNRLTFSFTGVDCLCVFKCGMHFPAEFNFSMQRYVSEIEIISYTWYGRKYSNKLQFACNNFWKGNLLLCSDFLAELNFNVLCGVIKNLNMRYSATQRSLNILRIVAVITVIGYSNLLCVSYIAYLKLPSH